MLVRNQIEFIEPTRPLERAKNDLHMNAAGNKTMAEEIYQYLIREKSAELAPYKK
jgi:lysophospholipase L1-like esterase